MFKMVKRILLLFFIFVLSSFSVLGVCTCVLDKEVYSVGENAVVECSCSGTAETNRAYTMTWYNGSTVLEVDGGTTPGTVDLPFFESYLIDDVYSDGSVNLTGLNLEGEDDFVSVEAGNNTLIITDIAFTPSYLLGRSGCVHFEVGLNNESVDDGRCFVDVHDVDDLPVDRSDDLIVYNGHCTGCLDITSKSFLEMQQYLGEIHCFSEGLVDGELVGATSAFVVNVSTWLEVNTITDKSNYVLDDNQVLVCANVSNYQDFRIPLKILYNYRCDGNDNDTDRIIVDSFEEIRGINGNTTQNQCAALKIYNLQTIADRVNECYAATDVMVLAPGNGMVEVLMTYSTRSETFNISSDSSILYDPDRAGENNMIAIVLAFILSICAFSVLGGLSIYLGRIKQIETARISFWVAFVSLGMALIQIVMLLFLIYANQVQQDFSPLLLINFYVCMLVGFGGGLIIMFQVITHIMSVKRLEDGTEGDKRFERSW